MASGPTTMRMLLAHQYARDALTLLKEDSSPTTHGQLTSSSPRRKRHLPFVDPSTTPLYYSDESPYLSSSVNRFTHRLPETLGAHYHVEPYYHGCNEFDRQLARTATSSTMRQPKQRAQTAGTRLVSTPSALKARQFVSTLTGKCIQDTTFLSGLSFPRLLRPSPPSSASSTRPRPPHRSTAGTYMTHPDTPIFSNDPDTEYQRSSPPVSSQVTALKSNSEIKPSTRLSVRWAHCIVRDELAVDRFPEPNCFVSTVTE